MTLIYIYVCRKCQTQFMWRRLFFLSFNLPKFVKRVLSRWESLINGTPVMITTTLHSILSSESVVAQKV